METRKTGIFAGEFLPAPRVYFGTDASGGPRGADPRLRVVSWAVVAIHLGSQQPHSEEPPEYKVIGSMSGTLQIGATVNNGESVALNILAEWASGPLRTAVDSKIAVRTSASSFWRPPKLKLQLLVTSGS